MIMNHFSIIRKKQTLVQGFAQFTLFSGIFDQKTITINLHNPHFSTRLTRVMTKHESL